MSPRRAPPAQRIAAAREGSGALSSDRHGAGMFVGRLSCGFLWVSCFVLACLTRISPEFHRNFTRTHQNFRIPPEFHRNFIRISNRSTLKKGITTTQPSQSWKESRILWGIQMAENLGRFRFLGIGPDARINIYRCLDWDSNTVGRGFENTVHFWRTLRHQATNNCMSRRAVRQKSQP